MATRILIVDDHEVLREGLKSLLAKSRSEWEICGGYADPELLFKIKDVHATRGYADPGQYIEVLR